MDVKEKGIIYWRYKGKKYRVVFTIKYRISICQKCRREKVFVRQVSHIINLRDVMLKEDIRENLLKKKITKQINTEYTRRENGAFCQECQEIKLTL